MEGMGNGNSHPATIEENGRQGKGTKVTKLFFSQLKVFDLSRILIEISDKPRKVC